MLVDRFADFAVSSRDRELPAEVVHAAVRVVVDWFAVTAPGGGLPPARALTTGLIADGETGHCVLVPGGRAVGPLVAGLVNGTAAHTVELDDIYRDGIYHPGAPTVAAALAAAQHVGADGPTFLRAVTVGYEVGDRIAAAMAPAHYRFWHPTATVGALGAAAAVAEVLSLDRTRFADALATAATMAAGLQQAFRSDAMSKPLHAGHAAQSGLVAGLGASAGLTGAHDILEGPAGFGAAMGVDPDWTAAVAGLGTDFRVPATTVKSHACCGHTFAAIDAALDLRPDVHVADVRRIEVATYRTACTVAGNPDPRTAFEAKFSIAYCVATALVHGSVRLDAFTPQRLSDPVVLSLIPKVELVVDKEFDDRFPTRRGARVTIDDNLTATRPTRKGDPDDPLSDADIRAKYDELMSPALGPERTATLAAGLWDLPSARDVRNLLPG
jgi:2-methylcitrate dehydratase PrpD